MAFKTTIAFKNVLWNSIIVLASIYFPSAAQMITRHESQDSIGYRNVGYFVNWAIYGRNYQPSDIPADILTHVHYAFANVNDTGEVYLTDTWADTEKHYLGDSWNDIGTNAYGCIKQLFLLKKKNRFLKTLLSIGGWTYRQNFQKPVSTKDGRTNFANTAVTLMGDLGFDGIDIDWEYPEDEEQAENFVLLLEIIRSTLDVYTTINGGNKMLLTVACSASPHIYSTMKLAAMASYLDFLIIMAYDYAGSWSNITGHQANLYPSTDSSGLTLFSTDVAVQDYVKVGVPADKIIMGMPLYGRAFKQTDGIGKPFHGVGEGSFEDGIWNYKVLPQAGAIEQIDHQTSASYSWDGARRVIVSYDNLAASNLKVEYIKKNGLGGGMFWELSGDRNDNSSLIANVFHGLSTSEMDKSQNTLSYPGSKYDNIRAGMPS